MWFVVPSLLLATGVTTAVIDVGPAQSSVAAPALAPPDSATTYQGDSVHDGLNAMDPLSAPLATKWSHTFPGQVGYPLFVNGRVLAAVSDGSDTYSDHLFALDAVTGATLWSAPLPGTYQIRGIAADGTNVYVVDFDGLLSAYNQVTGSIVWSEQLPNQWEFSSAPSVVRGVLYVDGAGYGGTLYAVDTSNGSILWTANLDVGGHATPAVTSSGVYLSLSCDVAYRFDPATGATDWTHTSSCAPADGQTPVVHGGNVYIREDGAAASVVLSASTGQEEGTYNSTYAPTFDRNLAFYTPGGSMLYGGVNLEAVDLTTGNVLWTQAGNGGFDVAPVVFNGQVAIGSTNGTVYVYNEKTGTLIWSGSVGSSISAADEYSMVLLSGLAVGGSMLLVPTFNSLVALSTAVAAPSSPPPVPLNIG